MKELIFLSPKPGGGVHTIAVNLAIGLSNQKLHVQLLSIYKGLDQWLKNTGSKPDTLLDRNTGLTWIQDDLDPGDYPDGIDFLLFIPNEKEGLKKSLARKNAQVLCVIDMTSDNINNIAKVSQAVKDIDPLRDIALFIPNKVKPGEWEQSSAMVFELAEKYGWEKIADSIPYCEAIHDLPKEKQSVWELPDNYSNRKAAFQSLVDAVALLGTS